MASQWENIKWITGTKLMVDGFRYQNPTCKSYLLTHFHSDHTTGLSKSFTAGLIFCTPVTATLLRKDMGMPAARICEIPMDKITVIEGCEVVPIDANHCPGACMFLIRTPASVFRKAQTILHTGDLRWDDSMAEHPEIKKQRIDTLFLDTTYAKPIHTHPPQDECIDMMVNIMKKESAANPKTLFVCGSYHIGKERAYLGAAKIFGCKVWCDANKRRVLRMLDLPDELMLLLTTRASEAKIHVDFIGGLRPERLAQRLENSNYTHVVGFRPTGWTYRRSGRVDCRREGNVKVYGIPYSEHSSWTELRSCVQKLRPKKLVPTVNASNAALAELIVSRFADLMDLSGDRSRLDFFMRKRQKLEPDTSHNSSVKSEDCQAAEASVAEQSEAAFWQHADRGSAELNGSDIKAKDLGATTGAERSPSGTLRAVEDADSDCKPAERPDADARQGRQCEEGKQSSASVLPEKAHKQDGMDRRGSTNSEDSKFSSQSTDPHVSPQDSCLREAEANGREQVETLVDVSGFSVAEQEQILLAIDNARRQQAEKLNQSLARTRQSCIANFFKK